LQEELLEQMSDDNQSVKIGWSSVQVYILSTICLLIGVTMGYLFRGSNAPKAAGASANSAVQRQMPGGTPAAGTGTAPAQPTPEAMKRMADKQVAPLLEQLQKNPKDAETLAKVGYYYMLSAQYDDAATYYEKSADVKPTAAVYTSLGNAQAYGQKPDKAIASLNHALQLDPKYADALFNLGVLKWRAKGDTKGAIACWETLLKTNPNHPHLDKVRELIAHVKEQGAPHTPATP
jgi:cytochrome c-type biogenesis protein CcmH/NrfG